MKSSRFKSSSACRLTRHANSGDRRVPLPLQLLPQRNSISPDSWKIFPNNAALTAASRHLKWRTFFRRQIGKVTDSFDREQGADAP
ncbi:hypothetical protein X945_5955 [Burkholderia pseudomallei ABCPW 107]|nr:hypothetical protein X945_5955 [Burkholderia pseudomallei ABCPW 107]